MTFFLEVGETGNQISVCLELGVGEERLLQRGKRNVQGAENVLCLDCNCYKTEYNCQN